MPGRTQLLSSLINIRRGLDFGPKIRAVQIRDPLIVCLHGASIDHRCSTSRLIRVVLGRESECMELWTIAALPPVHTILMACR